MFRLSISQIVRLSEFCSNLSLLFLGSVTLQILTGQETAHTTLVVLGFIVFWASLILSLIIAKNTEV